MTFSKKKRRKIIVNKQEYFWVALGDSGYINLYIMIDIQGGQKLNCYFHYHHHDKTDSNSSLSSQFVVTPFIVKQVIEYGLKNGWKPLNKGSEICFRHLDDKVNLYSNKK